MDKNTKALKLFIFYCSDNFNADEFNGAFTGDGDVEYKIISLPCSGKANLLYFVKAFETGADGLVLITCAKDACRFLEGNLRTYKRAEKVNQLLEEIGMGAGRIEVLTADREKPGIGKIAADVADFRKRLRSMEVRV